LKKYEALEPMLKQDFGENNVKRAKDEIGYNWIELDLTKEEVRNKPVIAFSTEINYEGNENNLENEGNGSIFAELNNNEYGQEQQRFNRISGTFARTEEGLDTRTENKRSIPTAKREQSVIKTTELLGNMERVAKEHETWIEHPEELISLSPIGKGFENEVFMSTDGKSVIKFNNLALSETIDRFLARIQAHNSFAPNVAYEILGIGKNSQGKTSIILKQRYIKGTPAPIEKIMLYLKEQGFKPARLSNGVNGFRNNEYEISDLWKNDGTMMSDNVLMDEKGHLYFIDIDIIRIKDIPKFRNNAIKGKTLDDTGLPLC
jgi:hypothetical protein